MDIERESKNYSLHKARKDKFNEFYTQKFYIEKELAFYKNSESNTDIFTAKTVYCNCDDPDKSEFWKYFKRNFAILGLKKLIATHYDPDGKNYSYKIETNSKMLDNVNPESIEPERTPLYCNGDFRSPSCISLLKDADIIVTNPPFSLFREYFAQLMEYGKKFLVIGNINAISYKEIFPYLRDEKVWLGRHCGGMEFRVPDSYQGKSYLDKNSQRYVKLGNICWFTNLDFSERHIPLNLHGNYYSEDKYPKYDNFDAIEVARISEIPQDYDGIMGVPVTYMAFHCPEQFRIIGLDRYTAPPESLVGGRLAINNVSKYARILIKRKDN